MAGIDLAAVRLSSVLAAQAIDLADPYYLSGCQCVPQMVIAEQPPMIEGAKIQVTAVEAPSTSFKPLAVQVHLAAVEGLSPRGTR